MHCRNEGGREGERRQVGEAEREGKLRDVANTTLGKRSCRGAQSASGGGPRQGAKLRWSKRGGSSDLLRLGVSGLDHLLRHPQRPRRRLPPSVFPETPPHRSGERGELSKGCRRDARVVAVNEVLQQGDGFLDGCVVGFIVHCRRKSLQDRIGGKRWETPQGNMTGTVHGERSEAFAKAGGRRRCKDNGLKANGEAMCLRGLGRMAS